MSQPHELTQLATRRRTLTVGGETLEIAPIQVGRIPDFVTALQRMDVAMDGDGIDVMRLVMEHTGTMIEAAALATDRDVTWLARLPADDFTDVALAVLEINADFFVRRFLTGVQEVVRNLTEAMQRAGSTVSSTSSNAATHGAT